MNRKFFFVFNKEIEQQQKKNKNTTKTHDRLHVQYILYIRTSICFIDGYQSRTRKYIFILFVDKLFFFFAIDG